MAGNKTPVTIWGIEFDALIDETKTLASSIPVYPVENGFQISDTIINDPVSLQLSLYLSNTPVTWLYRHGSSNDRVVRICNEIENRWLEKQLTKIVTSDAVYTDMGITSISIKKSKDIGYAREITVSAQKVRITRRQTVTIPDYIMQSGATMANAGKASVSGSSARSSKISGSSGSSGNSIFSSIASGASSAASGIGRKNSGSAAKKSQSILYGVASGIGLM